MQLNNDTPFFTERAVQLDINGNQMWVVVIKASFQYFPDGQVCFATEQEPIVLEPKYTDAIPASTMLRDNDIY